MDAPVPGVINTVSVGDVCGLEMAQLGLPRVWSRRGRAVLTLSGTERGCRQLLPTQLLMCMARGQGQRRPGHAVRVPGCR